MGMGESACYADVIKWEEVKKLCPSAVAAFEKSLPGYPEIEEALNEFCKSADQDNWDDFDDVFDTALTKKEIAERIKVIKTNWDVLCVSFETTTGVLADGGDGLTLGAAYHNPDEGSRYDDVSGAYFCVEGMYQLTPAGQYFNEIVARSRWTVYG